MMAFLSNIVWSFFLLSFSCYLITCLLCLKIPCICYCVEKIIGDLILISGFENILFPNIFVQWAMYKNFSLGHYIHVCIEQYECLICIQIYRIILQNLSFTAAPLLMHIGNLPAAVLTGMDMLSN